MQRYGLFNNLQVIGVALLLSYLFKTDRDISALEAELGTMADIEENRVSAQLGSNVL